MTDYVKEDITVSYEIKDGYFHFIVKRNGKEVEFNEQIPDGYNVNANLDMLLNECWLYGKNMMEE